MKIGNRNVKALAKVYLFLLRKGAGGFLLSEMQLFITEWLKVEYGKGASVTFDTGSVTVTVVNHDYTVIAKEEFFLRLPKKG